MASVVFSRARSGDCSDAETVLTPAAVHATDKLQRTPLHIAAWMGHARFVELLIGAGANVHAQAMDGVTALTFAAGKGHGAVVAALLASGGTQGINTQGGKKRTTALQLAAKGGHRDVVQKLLDAGADPLVRSKKGETAYDMTQAADFTMREVLREGGGFSRNKRKREERRGAGAAAAAASAAVACAPPLAKSARVARGAAADAVADAAATTAAIAVVAATITAAVATPASAAPAAAAPAAAAPAAAAVSASTVVDPDSDPDEEEKHYSAHPELYDDDGVRIPLVGEPYPAIFFSDRRKILAARAARSAGTAPSSSVCIICGATELELDCACGVVLCRSCMMSHGSDVAKELCECRGQLHYKLFCIECPRDCGCTRMA